MSSSSGSGATAERPRVIIFGSGNTFYGDDGIGYCLVKALEKCARINGASLVAVQALNPGHSALLEGYDYVVFIDAFYEPDMPGGSDIAVLDLDPSVLDEKDAVAVIDSIEPHSLDPLKLLVLARAAGIFSGKGVLIGVRPERVEFNKPLTGSVIRRGVKAVKALSEVLGRLGIAPVIEEECVERFLHSVCRGPLLD